MSGSVGQNSAGEVTSRRQVGSRHVCSGQVGINADQAAKFIIVDSLSQAGTIPGAADLASNWLTDDTVSTWIDWQQSDGDQTLQPCQFVQSSPFTPVPAYQCVVGNVGAWVIIIDKGLTKAKMYRAGG